MGKIRKCDQRCHNAKGTRCKCWCGGAFHGSAGAAARQAVLDNPDILREYGFEHGKTVFRYQQELGGFNDAVQINPATNSTDRKTD